MAVTVIVEDGTGLPDANSYAAVASADLYFATRPRSSLWAPLSADAKGQYLVHGTRILDAACIWKGEKLLSTQALAFPRYPADLEAGEVPSVIAIALYELAYSLISTDLTAEPATGGFEQIKVGPIEIKPNPGDRLATIPRFVRDLIAAYGTARANMISVPLTRR